MPYSVEELQHLPFYQTLQTADERAYTKEIETLRTRYNVSGSAADLILRDYNGIILSHLVKRKESLEEQFLKLTDNN